MKRLGYLLRVVRPLHTLFALPFAYLGAILGSSGRPSLYELWWITVAMFAARSLAMAWNRWVDRRFDALNPRTANREIPTGLVSGLDIAVAIGTCIGLLLWAAAKLHPMCVKVFPLAVVIPVFYSLTKRFTYLSHFFLGASLAFGPIGAWLAVAGHLPPPAYTWGAAVVLWVAGFDIFYQAQDVEFDRKYGLYSIPACFGVKRSVAVAMVLHIVSLILFVIGGLQMDVGLWHFVGMAIVTLMFIKEYHLVKALEPAGFTQAFQVNLAVSLVLLLFTGAGRML